MHPWLNHYSMGVCVYETLVFKVTQDIEAAKLFHLWLMLATFLLTLSFFYRFGILPSSLSFFISLLAAFSPVAIYQSLSFYLDGQLISLMVTLIVILAFIYRKSHPYYYLLLFLVISIPVNVKLTAPMYTAIFLLAYLLFLWMRKRIRQLSHVFMVSSGALLIGLLLFGFSPYVTNTLSHGNPFYSALGTDRLIYTLPPFPSNFIGKNSVSLLFYSIFAKSDNVRGPDKKAHLKIPFTVCREELNAFTDTNAKQGGFGPLFGGAILLSFLILFMAWRDVLARLRKGAGGKASRFAGPDPADGKPWSNHFFASFCMGVVLFSCLINPASSLARFIPQMWLFSLFAVLFAYSLGGKFLRIVGHLVILTLLVNNLLIGWTYSP